MIKKYTYFEFVLLLIPYTLYQLAGLVSLATFQSQELVPELNRFLVQISLCFFDLNGQAAYSHRIRPYNILHTVLNHAVAGLKIQRDRKLISERGAIPCMCKCFTEMKGGTWNPKSASVVSIPFDVKKLLRPCSMRSTRN